MRAYHLKSISALNEGSGLCIPLALGDAEMTSTLWKLFSGAQLWEFAVEAAL